jgi:hypothetical protein
MVAVCLLWKLEFYALMEQKSANKNRAVPRRNRSVWLILVDYLKAEPLYFFFR